MGAPFILRPAVLRAAPLTAAAQTAGVPRIGFLDPSPASSSRERVQQLRQGLKALGYQEQRHYALEYRSAEGSFEKLPGLADELVRLPVRVIVARNTPGTTAARGATRTIPIVMADVGDPLALGFVSSMSRPGGNITGLSNATIELLRKRLDWRRACSTRAAWKHCRGCWTPSAHGNRGARCRSCSRCGPP